MTKTGCVGGRQYSNTNNIIQYDKCNPKIKKLVKIIKGTCNICSRNKSQIFIMTKGEDFFKRGKCKDNHCSSMSNRAWCDLNRKENILKLHDKCPNPKCNCPKIVTFTL